jgi:membrane associated rhomboid family serine protease
VTDHDPYRSPFEVFAAPSRHACNEPLLVLRSVGVPCELQLVDGLWRLYVPAPYTATGRDELARYFDENRAWPPPRLRTPMLSDGSWGAILYAAVLIVLYPIGLGGFAGRNWWEPGRVDAALILDGECWRAATALTLHADLSHLVGNLVFGILFGVLASHTLGSGLTWLSTVAAGVAGNLLNALIQNPGHRAIGASTAVFGTLGLLAVYEWVRRRDLELSSMRHVSPLLGGALLLGFLGMGREGGNTDVMAHVMGFLAGSAFGLVAGYTRLPERLSPRAQVGLGLTAVGVLALGWAAALARSAT